MKFDWNLHDAFEQEIFSGQITFWTAMVREIIPRYNPNEKVFEYCSWDEGFLRLLFSMRSFKEGLGFSECPTFLEKAVQQVRTNEPINFCLTEKLSNYNNYFDFAFSTEIFSFEPNIELVAKRVYQALKNQGEYYATFGCHIENPLWSHRRRLLKDRGQKVFDYSIEEVADVFFKEGFEVGVKRLPVDYFNIYNPAFTRERAQSLTDLINTTYENKMLFYFRKDNSKKLEKEE